MARSAPLPSYPSTPLTTEEPDYARAEAELLGIKPWLRIPPSTPVHTPGSIEEMCALLPWLGTPPPRPSGPAPGSMEEMLSILPWLDDGFGLAEPTGPRPGSMEEMLELLPWLGSGEDDPQNQMGGAEPKATGFLLEDAPKVQAPDPREGRPIRNSATLGVNAPKLLDYYLDFPTQIVYGTTHSILDDLETVGARFMRQPDRTDLFWPADAVMPVVNAGLPVAEAVEDVYDALIAEGEEFGLFTALVAQFRSITPASWWSTDTPHDTQVVLTLFTNGFNNYSGRVDPSNEHDMATGMVALDWDPTHAGNTESLWGETLGGGYSFTIDQYLTATDFGATLVTPAPSGSVEVDEVVGWTYGTLDLRSPYKLKYLYYVGYAYGLLLQRVNDEVVSWGHEEIWGRILGVEVFNECNKACPFEYKEFLDHTSGYGRLLTPEGTIEAGAIFWARAARELVRGLQHAFFEYNTTRTSPVTLPLWLPSMAMYAQNDSVVTLGTAIVTGPPFANILYFQRKLCEHLVDGFQSDEADCPDRPFAPDFTWFVNQDYHYYNYKSTQDPGPIIRLPAEIDALRDTFRDVTSGGLGVNALAERAVTVSVCENGAAANPDTTDTILRPGGDFPYLVTSPTSNERFQAREVWRRLAAAATAARYVGWHTHMSALTNAADTTQLFHFLGLRDDVGWPEDTTPNAVDTRLSWWAYQRLASLVYTGDGAARGGLVARFTRRPPASADLYRTFTADDLGYVGVAIHFLIADDDHAYLLFIDPSAGLATTGQVVVSSLSTHPFDLAYWASIPDAVSPPAAGYPTDNATLPANTPDERLTPWVAAYRTDSGASAYTVWTPNGSRFVPDQDPILIRTTTPLAVAWVP